MPKKETQPGSARWNFIGTFEEFLWCIYQLDKRRASQGIQVTKRRYSEQINSMDFETDTKTAQLIELHKRNTQLWKVVNRMIIAMASLYLKVVNLTDDNKEKAVLAQSKKKELIDYILEQKSFIEDNLAVFDPQDEE